MFANVVWRSATRISQPNGPHYFVLNYTARAHEISSWMKYRAPVIGTGVPLFKIITTYFADQKARSERPVEGTVLRLGKGYRQALNQA